MSIPNPLRSLITISSGLDDIESRGIADTQTFEFCRLVQDWLIDHWDDGHAAEKLAQHLDEHWGK